MTLLITHGLMPVDEVDRKALETLDPYELRAKALDDSAAHHIGRALFHLNQRRGFLPNRKTEKKDSESGAIKTAAGKLQKRDAGVRRAHIGRIFRRPPSRSCARSRAQPQHGRKGRIRILPDA